MQKITIMGNMGRDAQVRESSNGRKFVTFSVAVNSQRNGETKTSWYNVVWFNYNQNMIDFLKKGHIVVVGGDLDADLRVDQTGATRIERNVFADYVQFALTSRKEDESGTTPSSETKESSVNVADDEEVSVVGNKKKTTNTTKFETPAGTSDEESDLPF